MKSALVRSLIAILFCVCVRFTFAGDFHSQVIPTGGTVSLTDVPANHFLRIRNFTQNAGPTRATISVTPSGGSAIIVLSAAIVSNASTAPDTINSVVIAGPAKVEVIPGTSPAYITYIKQSDSD